ncbi:hypothetical protein NEUTE1DRAFT_106737 [Neurospora tetrasperma FGSC 2508]|uniref:FAD-binding domain-containing protein n=1 Tax=Neurospora tetrasperma (strain FGSC 2508 / ATCC MYA-4615 / P0657) TaxID=510951 RepID=F8MF23_NEUT8|nr:uncharacterized protein NEUTE1DRAFT_106737 [Neurospora tetrasperma FGSC 2508]EGO60075.1 hypothetical protein NEUTE1DRAFT_106737 [Neurospora tetrasperma FGSC 2508]
MAASKDSNPSQPTVHGFTVLIYDSEPHLNSRPRDWTIALHWALPIFSSLLPSSILANFDHAVSNPHLDFDEWAETLPMYNGETGDLMFKSAVPGARRITRRGLREVLSDGLDIAWGRKVTRLDTESNPEKVKVTLEGEEGVEEEVWADFVLGTDGAGSKVREILFADQENGEEKAKAKRSGFMIGTCVVDYQDEDVVRKVLEKHPVMAMAMSRGAVGAFGVQYTTGTPPSNLHHTFFWTKIWKGSLSTTPDLPRKGPEAVRYLKQSWQGDLSPDFQSFVDVTPEDDTHTQAFIDEMGTWIAQPFDNRDGRVTLAGDAGHPMLILRGQGFQHAVIDVQNYVQALLAIRDSGADRKDLVAAYDKDMVERGSEAALQALEEAELAMDAKSVEKMLMVRKGHGRSV